MADKPKTTRALSAKNSTDSTEGASAPDLSTTASSTSSTNSAGLDPAEGEASPVVEVGEQAKGFEITVSNTGCGDQRFEAKVVWHGNGCCDDPCEDKTEEEPEAPTEDEAPRPCEEDAPPEDCTKPTGEPCDGPRDSTPEPQEHSRCPDPDSSESPEPEPDPSLDPVRCVKICLGVSSELAAGERMVFLTEAVAKINARLFARDSAKAMPCCVRCAGLELDEETLLRDARCLLETKKASSASIVAYSMGRELATGVECRVVLVNGQRLAYQREDGSVLDPVSKFENPTQEAADDGDCSCE